MTLTPLASATSAMKTTSRPISFGQGSTKVPSPRSLSSLSRSRASLSAVLRSNRGALQSSSHPAHPTSRCSCIRVVPSLSVLIVPVTVLIVFMLALLGLRRRADVSRTHMERSNPLAWSDGGLLPADGNVQAGCAIKTDVEQRLCSQEEHHARDKAADGPGPQHGLPRIRSRSRCRSPGKDAQGGARKNSTHRRELHHCLRRGRGGGWRQYRAAATGLFLRLHRVLTADPGCPVRAHDEGENRQGPDACNRARSPGGIGPATDNPGKLAGNRDPLGTRVQRAAGAIGRSYPKRREWMLRIAGAPESRACGAYGFCKRSSLQTAVTLEGKPAEAAACGGLRSNCPDAV